MKISLLSSIKFPGITKASAIRKGILMTLLYIALALRAMAQPSGGPYGPVPQNYPVPKINGTIYYVSPDGSTSNTGRSLDNPTTLEKAIARVVTGDAIIMRGGIYRTGNLLLNQGITIQPFGNEKPVIKGTYIADEWKSLGNGLWKTEWKHLFPAKPAEWWSRDRFGKETPLHRFNDDMVFIDGKFLQSAGYEAEVGEDTFYIDYDAGMVYIGTDPTGRLVEITAFNIAILRTTGECHGKTSDKTGPVIRGITFTQYAYRAIDIEGTDPEGLSHESQHGKQVVGTVLENCEISFCSRVGAYLKGDNLVLRNCKVSDTSTEGIYIIASNDALLERNIFTRNNIERITGYYPAAVKIFNQSYRVTCRDNLVIDLPWSNGIWYDVGNVDGVFVNNWIQDVGNVKRAFDSSRPWPSDNGFFFEISKGVICTGNLFVNCDQGIFILNASDAHIYNNTLINSIVSISRNGRSPENDRTFGWHSGTGPDVDKRDGHIFVNNLLFADAGFNRPLFYVWQPENLCAQLNKSPLKSMDGNAFVHPASAKPVILFSPADGEKCMIAVPSPEELRERIRSFSGSCRIFGTDIPLFKSRLLGNYRLLPSSPVQSIAVEVPESIKKLLGLSKKYVKYTGAFPL